MSDSEDNFVFSGLTSDLCYSTSELVALVQSENTGIDIGGLEHERPVYEPEYLQLQTRNERNFGAPQDGGTSHSPGTLDQGVDEGSVTEGDVDLKAFLGNVRRNKRRKGSRKAANQAKRMRGESYVGYTVVKSTDGGTKVLETNKPPRKMGERCRSNVCKKRHAMYCDEFTEENRNEIFKSFWKLDWDQKISYVVTLIDKVPVKRRTANTTGKRNELLVYCLKLGEARVQVCRSMFLSTLGLGVQQVLGWVKKSSSGIPAFREKKRRTPVTSDKVNHVHEFLSQLPKLPSHYCRSSTSKLYLETHITSRAQLYKMYQNVCNVSSLPVVSESHFWRIFQTKNIGIFSPKKDRCDVCIGYENKQVSEDEYIEHQKRKETARSQKTFDKSDALCGKCHILCMDMQAVKLSPVLNASSLYYKTKLMSHNFSIYNLVTKDAVCYWWDESEGDLQSSVYASCITDYIKTYLNDQLPVILYSDGCVSQNRNNILGNALLDLAITQKRVIFQNYLEKGHTQMECDSVHAVIEVALRKKFIYVPEDYIKITEEARAVKPYIVRKLTHDFFKDFSPKNILRYSSIRPGTKKGDPCVTDLKNLKYLPEGIIQYKLSYEQRVWKELPEKPKKIAHVVYGKLFSSRRRIAARKFKDLQEIKAVIPSEYHAFYDNLPHD